MENISLKNNLQYNKTQETMPFYIRTKRETLYEMYIIMSQIYYQANVNYDVLELPGDNLLDFSLEVFVEFSKNGNAVMRCYELEIARLQRTGVTVLDNNNLVLEMTKKLNNLYLIGKSFI